MTDPYDEAPVREFYAGLERFSQPVGGAHAVAAVVAWAVGDVVLGLVLTGVALLYLGGVPLARWNLLRIVRRRRAVGGGDDGDS